MTAAPQSLEELKQIFDNELDYSWWKMQIMEEGKYNFNKGVTLYYMDSDSSYYALLVDDDESEPIKLMDYENVLYIQEYLSEENENDLTLFEYILIMRTSFDWEEYPRELLPEFMKDKIILKIEG